MNIPAITAALKEYPQHQVENYVAYLQKLETEKNRDKTLKNPWMKYKKDDYLIRIFITIAKAGLVFDGEDIILQNTGVHFSWHAYKNKMLIAYPESLIDVSLVYKGDTFSFSKQSGQVIYNHVIANPFDKKDKDIIGGYCVIKNNRGQFLTSLSIEEINKHRKVAKTDKIWSQWFPEMCFKTVIKKACKQHFKDSYHDIEKLDNENYDLEQLPENPEQPKILLNEDNINWLIGFCNRNKITTKDDKKELQTFYSFDPYKTTDSDFEEIKSKMMEDYNEAA